MARFVVLCFSFLVFRETLWMTQGLQDDDACPDSDLRTQEVNSLLQAYTRHQQPAGSLQLSKEKNADGKDEANAIGCEEDPTQEYFKVSGINGGVAGPIEIRLFNADNKGVQKCYEEMMGNSKCSKKYFTYWARRGTVQQCGCQGKQCLLDEYNCQKGHKGRQCLIQWRKQCLDQEEKTSSPLKIIDDLKADYYQACKGGKSSHAAIPTPAPKAAYGAVLANPKKYKLVVTSSEKKYVQNFGGDAMLCPVGTYEPKEGPEPYETRGHGDLYWEHIDTDGKKYFVAWYKAFQHYEWGWINQGWWFGGHIRQKKGTSSLSTEPPKPDTFSPTCTFHYVSK